jgi:hypothetical protein
LIPLSKQGIYLSRRFICSERGKPDERGLRPLSLCTPLFRWIKARFNEMLPSGKVYGRNINQMQIVPKVKGFDCITLIDVGSSSGG